MSISLGMSTSVTLLRRTPKPHQKRGARKTEIVVRASKANTSSESAAQSNRRQIEASDSCRVAIAYWALPCDSPSYAIPNATVATCIAVLR